MQATIIHTESDQEYFFKEGCYILELSNSEQDEGLSIARARVTPGVSTQCHQLSQTIERYIILSGEGLVSLNRQSPQKVVQNDVVIIPKNCPQSIKNIGSSDLIFLVICTPRFLPENYQAVI